MLWFGLGDERLPQALRVRLAEERVHVSEITRCEIVINEQARGRPFPVNVDELMEKAGFVALPFEAGAHRKLKALPMLHRDPFDRLLIAHAMSREMPLVTRDRMIRRYDVQVVW